MTGRKGGTFTVFPGCHLASLRHWAYTSCSQTFLSAA